jgi:hypothetical protein
VQLTPYGDYHIDDVVEFLVQDLYEAGSPAQQAAIAIAMKKAHKKPKTEAKATKTRLDPKCWTGKHIGTPATKVKGGVRVNNCVPNESVAEGVGETPQQQKVRAAISSGLAKSSQMGKAEYQSQPTNRTYFDNAGYASDKLTGIDSIDPDGTVVISIGDTRANDWVKKLAALGGMPGVKTREVQPKLAQGVAEAVWDRPSQSYVPRDGRTFGQTNHPREEHCDACGAATGHAGPGEDSNVDDEGNVYCDDCYADQKGVAEGYSNTTFNVDRRKLNVPALIQKGAILVTHPHGEQGWETDNNEDWAFSLLSLYNVLQGGWASEAKKYLKPESYKRAEQQINSSAPNLGSDRLVYDG